MVFTVIMMIIRVFTGYEDKTSYGGKSFFEYLLLKKENVYLVWWIITSLAMLFISFIMAYLFFKDFIDYLIEENYYHIDLFWAIISLIVLIMFSIGYYIYQKNQLRNQQN
jgi:heme/copper-type cytochrome/quinol oxidase subunit 3